MDKDYCKLCGQFDLLSHSEKIIFITNRLGFAKSDDIAWEYNKRQLDKF